MFSPLSGDENEKRLEEKYSDTDVDVNCSRLWSLVEQKTFKNKTDSSSKKSQKSVVAVGGNAISPSVKPYRASRTSQDKSQSARGEPRTHQDTPLSSLATSPVASRSSQSEDGGTEVLGYDEEDLEKPQFTFPPCAAKVPYQLSETGESPVIQVPATINQYLRDYQREGIKFLYSHYREGQGAILGDDMGLGKTVQVIGFLAALLGKHGNKIDVMRQRPSFIRKLSDTAALEDQTKRKPFLIIGPGCVLYNWLDELDIWGYFTTRKFHGSDKIQCLTDVKRGKVDIVVTTFETFRDNQNELNSVDWGGVIVDEVHRIKDVKVQITKALRTVSTKLRFGLSGTLMQNNMTELWSLLDWAQPGCLGKLSQFVDEYVNVIEQGQKHDASKRELAVARKKSAKFSDIRRQMMIRRTKSIITSQLPKKDDNVVFCKLTDLQTDVYRAVLDHPDMEVVLKKDDACTCGSGQRRKACCFSTTSSGEPITNAMFTFMHLLLKTSNHVALLIPRENTSTQQSQYSAEIRKLALSRHTHFVEQTREAAFRTLSDPQYCGKMKVLQGLLSVFHKKHDKVLVFSYSTLLLDILEPYLMCTGYEYRRMDGSTTAKKRLDIVHEFNRDPNIFICLISTKAGGMGLNLTGANRVVIFDPSWNPTLDLQAQDRAYRIGQCRDVAVYRLISAGTIEENMYLRQIYKQQLSNVVVEGENAKRFFYGIQGNRREGELFGLQNMFKFRTGDSCLTMDVLKRNEKIEAGLVQFKIAEYIPAQTVCQKSESDVTASGDEADSLMSEKDTEEEEDVFADFWFNSLDASLMEELDVDKDLLDSCSVIKGGNADKKTKKRSTNGSQLSSTPSGQFHKHKVKFEVVDEERSPASPGPSFLKRSKERRARETTTEADTGVAPTDRKTDQSYSSVSSVFENCGVIHVHENVKIVGGSKAEDHMTRCAIQDVYELHQNTQDPALLCDPYSESCESESEPETKPVQKGGRGKKEDHNTPRAVVVANTKILIGQTPKAIRRQQFQKLCKFLKEDSAASVAERVLSASVEERRDMLREFYVSGDQNLSEAFQITPKAASGHTPTLSSKKDSRKRKVRKSLNMDNPSIGSSSRITKKLKPGVVFSSHSDDELCPQRGSVSEHDEEDLDIGATLSPARKRQRARTATTRLRNPRSQATASTSSSTVRKYKPTELKVRFPDESAHGCEDVADFRHKQNMDTEDSSMELGHDPTEGLLDQMEDNVDGSTVAGEEQYTTIDLKTVPSNSGFSALNNIFLGTKKGNKPPRRPPPSRKKQLPDSDISSTTGTDEKHDSVDILDEVFGNKNSEHGVSSTLRDDSWDCFDAPSAWKKRRRRVVSPGAVADKLISESNLEYEKLFTSGKMKKLSSEQRSGFAINCQDNNCVSEGFQSRSLFSSEEKSKSPVLEKVGTPSLF